MLDETQILNIVSQELKQAAGGNENDFIDANRQAALATYLGQPNGKEVEGRSTVVSTDVADAIEWIMPEIIKAFTQNNEVVTFDPCYDGDEQQAELESQYVYDILMKENEGFIILHQFIKDALMQKNGFVKIFYDDLEERTFESYTGLTDIELEVLLMDEELELAEQTTESVVPEMTPQQLIAFKQAEEQYNQAIEQYPMIAKMAEEQGGQVPPKPEPPMMPDPINMHDVKVIRVAPKRKITVISVPPEEFRINKQHNSIDVSTARFSAHVMLTTAGDLVESGLTKEEVDAIPSSKVYEDDRNYRFYMQGETVSPDGNDSHDPSLREIEVAECYMHMDIDEDGVAEYVKITATGGDNPDHLLEWEEIDDNPFISTTAILMSHKLFGLSIYDRLQQIQEQKTTLWRNILDNMYLQNNQRSIVLDGQVNLDDLLVSRPGGIIRAKSKDAITPYATPPLPSDAYKMMDYLDQVRAGRAGVTPEGPVTDSMIGDRVGSEGVQAMMSQKEELVGLMIRVIAETGIKPMCYKIRGQVVKHQDTARDYMFRGQWVQVDPSTWPNRSHTTVRVGTGSGNRKDQMAAIGFIMAFQEKMSAMPGQALITPNETFNAVNDYAKFAGMPSARRYVLDPQSPDGQSNAQTIAQNMQAAKQEKDQKDNVLLEAQAKVAQAEVQKAEAQQANVQLKAESDRLKGELDQQKTYTSAEIDLLKQQLEEVRTKLKAKEHEDDLAYKYWDSGERHRIEELRITTAAQGRDND